MSDITKQRLIALQVRTPAFIELLLTSIAMPFAVLTGNLTPRDRAA